MRYAGSALGLFWAFAQPLLQLMLFTFVFSTIMKIPLTGERGIDSFPLFLFAGLLPWMAVQEVLTRSTTGVQDNIQIIQKASFPPALLVLSILAAATIHESFALGAFCVVLLAGGKASIWWLALPVVMAAQSLMLAGPALVLFSLQVFFRDTIQLVTYLVMVWFYFTPIVYPLSLVRRGVEQGYIPGWVLTGLRYNPAAIVAEGYRDVLLRGTMPDWTALGILTCGSIGVLWVARKMYRALRPHFADCV